MRIPAGRRRHGAAFVLYLAASVVLFGAPVVPHLASRHVGVGTDPLHAIWSLAWWPYAVRHGLDPMMTAFLWAPLGDNLAWGNAIPGLSLAALPVTLTLGPVVAFNLLAVLAPPTAAWFAYRLAFAVTGAAGAAFLGGWIFGFGSYVVAKMTGHLNLAFVAAVPAAAWVVWLHLRGRLGAVGAVAALAAALVFEFLVSLEVAAMLTLFGGVTLVVGYAAAPAVRPRLRQTVAVVALAYVASGVALAPYLFYALRFGEPRESVNDPRVHASDVVNLVVPTRLTLLGGDVFGGVSARFLGNAGEQAAYLGLPLLAIIGAFARRRWRAPGPRVALVVLGVITVASFGPQLNVLGHSTVSMPWRALVDLPLLKHALPARFMLYAFLVVGLIVAMWLAEGAGRSRWALALLAVVALAPNPVLPLWSSELRVPPFFANGTYREFIAPGENVLVVPFGAYGEGELWQLSTGMAFRMASGINSVVPESFRRWPILLSLTLGRPIPDAREQLALFLRAHGLRTIVLGARDPYWRELFGSLATPVEVGGVTVYQLAGAPAAAPPPAERERLARLAQARALVHAAAGWLAGNRPVAELSPRRAAGAGLVSRYWRTYRRDETGDDRPHWVREGLRLGPWEQGRVGLAVSGAPDDLALVIANYGPLAERVVTPFPAPDHRGPRPDGVLLVFTEAGIHAAARR